MEEVSILLKHSGFWSSDHVYETKSIDGIVVRSDVTLKLLKNEIACQLGIDQTRKNIRLRYIIDGAASPMEVRNEMALRMFLSFVKNIGDVAKFPLCVDVFDVEAGSSSLVLPGFDTATGTVDCMESVDACRALMVIPTNEHHRSVDVTTKNQHVIIADPCNAEVRVRQVYKDKKTLISVMHKYALRHRFQFHVKRSCSTRYVLKCAVNNCPWLFQSSSIKDSTLFMVHKFNNIHACSLPDRGFRQRNATSKMVAALCMQQLRDYKRIYTPGDIKADILDKMGVDISYNKAWRAKELALKTLLGGPAEGYLRLPVYLHVLGTAYPGSCLRYKKSEKNHFMYLFIALNVSIQGFAHCRPIVVVDGSHLKGPYLGTFVSASTLDGAGNILPLAYGVVDNESDASWTWFFEQFRDAYGVRADMAIVSDRNESIWKSVRNVFPEVPHFACMWHVWKNVCKHYRRSADTLSAIYYKMAKSYRREEFNDLMAELEAIDPRVKAYLCEIGYDKWARSYARINRGRMTTSNIAECINACLVHARKLPFLDFLEKARELFAKWNVVNGEKARYMSPMVLGSRFEEIYTLNDMRSVTLRAMKSSEHVYTVDSDGIRYIVCLLNHTCTCNRFQYDGVPCEHAIAVLRSLSITDIMPYCSRYYKKETLEKIYEIPFAPMPLKEQWSAPNDVMAELVLPPVYKRPPGRPRNGRVKTSGESLRSKTNRCGKCGRTGHNRRSCSFFSERISMH